MPFQAVYKALLLLYMFMLFSYYPYRYNTNYL